MGALPMGKAARTGAMKKAMKAKRVSKIAKGRMAKALVFRGSKSKTSGGLQKDSLMKNKRGKVVSKRASANGKMRFRAIEAWVERHGGAEGAPGVGLRCHQWQVAARKGTVRE